MVSAARKPRIAGRLEFVRSCKLPAGICWLAESPLRRALHSWREAPSAKRKRFHFITIEKKYNIRIQETSPPAIARKTQIDQVDLTWRFTLSFICYNRWLARKVTHMQQNRTSRNGRARFSTFGIASASASLNFGSRLHYSAMAVSRWETGKQEPTSRCFIQLGNMAGQPECWLFWARAGLKSSDLRQMFPGTRAIARMTTSVDFEIVRAGSGAKRKRPKGAPKLQMVAVPLLDVHAGTIGQDGRPVRRF